MLYISTIRIIKTETIEEYTKTYSIPDTHLVEADNEELAKQKIIDHYSSQQTPTTTYEVEFNSIHNTLV